MVFRKGPMQLRFSADSRHGIHRDGRGHVGGGSHLSAIEGAGVSTICMKAPSPFSSPCMSEALVAYVTTAELVWLHGMATAMGFTQETVVLEQDDLSTIRILEK